MTDTTSGSEPYANAPFFVTNGSRRVAALPEIPLIVSTTPCSFFSRHAVMNAARSIVRIFVRMPTDCSHPAIASAIALYGGNGFISPASKPFGYPASASSCRARRIS